MGCARYCRARMASLGNGAQGQARPQCLQNCVFLGLIGLIPKPHLLLFCTPIQALQYSERESRGVLSRNGCNGWTQTLVPHLRFLVVLYLPQLVSHSVSLVDRSAVVCPRAIDLTEEAGDVGRAEVP